MYSVQFNVYGITRLLKFVKNIAQPWSMGHAAAQKMNRLALSFTLDIARRWHLVKTYIMDKVICYGTLFTCFGINMKVELACIDFHWNLIVSLTSFFLKVHVSCPVLKAHL